MFWTQNLSYSNTILILAISTVSHLESDCELLYDFRFSSVLIIQVPPIDLNYKLVLFHLDVHPTNSSIQFLQLYFVFFVDFALDLISVCFDLFDAIFISNWLLFKQFLLDHFFNLNPIN
ncbi:uncharacterized protein MELLADRAFT_96128 [Melampsora larici-populina 98AG31]|uniref:Uncharacterized protein n=1 Tax=Melampsora larici-populina (strain 98AG31 / pathotype 3-4-7) TaxID=747676 RepID=F4SB28_MELLP|nr:uncharacterized protein MELLADRAFT_96128 [Melampsora larici-populina 98AG31]EGF98148.1 hypothetical protein MELLADRAFT_96128 [Melampsora larici-populina 98AG31]